MGQRTSTQPKPNISFAWVLRGDQGSSTASSTSSSLYKKPISPRSFEWRTDDSYTYTTINKKQQHHSHPQQQHHHHRRQHQKHGSGAVVASNKSSNNNNNNNKHHLFSEKNLKDSGDLDDYRFRRALIEGDCLSLSTAETTSISKCVDKATSVKKKRYRSKSRTAQRPDSNGNNRLEPYATVIRPKSECRTALVEVQMPRFDEDTSQFDEYLRKVSHPSSICCVSLLYLRQHFLILFFLFFDVCFFTVFAALSSQPSNAPCL